MLQLNMKICSTCKIELPKTAFNWIRTGKKRRGVCRECQNATKRKWYAQSKVAQEKALALSWANRKRNRDYILKYLQECVCADCGIGDYRVLEFDHVTGIKRENVSTMVHLGYSIKSLEEEIAKCKIRCSNCHRIRHYNNLASVV